MSEQATKKQRTIQVKIGNQAARAMTPDQAADYLKNIAGKGWGSGRELKMTFDNGSTSTVALPRTSGRDFDGSVATAAIRSTSTRADGMPCSEKEMKALMSMFVEIMGLQMNTDRLNQVKTTAKKKASGPRFSFPAGICPPPGGWPEDLLWPTAVDDDTDESVESVPDLEEIPLEDRPKHILFAQEAAKKAIRRPKPITPFPPAPGSKETPPEDLDAPVTGTEGISPYEWSALERAAIEDALEQEERFRKDSGRDKKNKASMAPTSSKIKFSDMKSPSATAQEAAVALQKVEAANKKLSKAVSMWRTRVVSAVTQNEVQKLEALLAESPLPTVTSLQQQAASVFTSKTDKVNSTGNSNPHLEFLVPMTVPKNAGSTKGSETRMILAKYLLQEFSPSHFFSPGRNGRSAVHVACLAADHAVLKLIIEKARKKWTADKLCEALMEPCQDSGWTPLHYAVSSGSMRTVETLLKACGEKNLVQKMVLTVTNDMTTWKRGTNKGVTAQFLAEALVSRKPEKMIDTHGMALQETVSYYKLEAGGTECIMYLPQVTAISRRLVQIETMGYAALNEKDMLRAERELLKQVERQLQTSAASVASTASGKESQNNAAIPDSDDEDDQSQVANEKKKGKKKKKKKGGSVVSASASSKGNNTIDREVASVTISEVSKPSSGTDDPLVTALIGMGFELESIAAGIKACGGLSRATADDVVARIFGGGEAAGNVTEPEPAPAVVAPIESTLPPATETVVAAERRNLEEVRQREEERIAAEKLAVKREEQRRRNREWNNRAQARQLQEAQEKVAKAAQSKLRAHNGALRTGLAPASTFFPSNSTSGLRGPSPTLGATQTSAGFDSNGNRKVSTVSRMVGRLNLGPSAADRNLDNGYSNDGSTVVSADLGVIEVGGNDDATVSTIGSFPAVQQPMSSSTFAPPGFSADQAPFHARDSRLQWDTPGTLPSTNEVYGLTGTFSQLGATGFSPSFGIPESGPFLDSHGSSHSLARSTSLNLPSAPNQLPQALGSFSAASTDFATGGSSLFGGATAFVRNDSSQHLTSGMGSSLLPNPYSIVPPRSGLIERATTVPSPNVSSYMTEAPGMPGLFGFGADLNQKTLDSSIIDSISTGNTAIGGSTLWGGTTGHTNSGSSLLGNLINGSTGYQPENSISLNDPSARYAGQSFHSAAAPWEQSNNVPSSQESGNGTSNIW
jgi:hypothetical protein